MKKSISFLLCGAMMMTGMFCKKDSSKVKEYTNEETVQKMVRDSDFVQLYRGIVEYNARVGASGQVAMFASSLNEPKVFTSRAREHFDQMVLKFPLEEEQEMIENARLLNTRYGLSGRDAIELRELLTESINIIDPVAEPVASGGRINDRCWDDLIKRESRCDRDMAIGGFESVIFGSAGILAATGAGIPVAAGIATGGLIIKWVRHSNCINDALVDYKECINPR